MTPAETARISGAGPTCPLCHTVDQMVTSDSPRRGATWTCARCGQTWSPERLETVAAYMRYAAAH